MENGRFAIWGLRDTYYVHIGLIVKRAMVFLLVLIERFPLAVTAEALRAKIYRKSAILHQRGHFLVQGVAPPHQ